MEIAHLAIRWQSLQTFLKTKKLANIPPSKVGGFINCSLKELKGIGTQTHSEINNSTLRTLPYPRANERAGIPPAVRVARSFMD